MPLILEPQFSYPIFEADFGEQTTFSEPGETAVYQYRTGEEFPWDWRTTYIYAMNWPTLTASSYEYTRSHEVGNFDEIEPRLSTLLVDVVAVDDNGEEKFGVLRAEHTGGSPGWSPFIVTGGAPYSLTDVFLDDSEPLKAHGLKVKFSIPPAPEGFSLVPVSWEYKIARPTLFLLGGPDNYQTCIVDD